MGHLDRRHGRVETFVAGLAAGAVGGLFHRVGGEHAEGHGDAGFSIRGGDAAGCFAGDVIDVRRIAFDHGSEADDGVGLCGTDRQRMGGNGKLPGTRHVDDVNLLQVSPVLLQGIEGAGQQRVRHEAVEAAYDDCEAESGRAQIAIEALMSVLAHLPVNTAFRFSRKALVPSRRSSDAAVNPKAIDSNRSPSSKPPLAPQSTDSMVNATASGPFEITFAAHCFAAASNSCCGTMALPSPMRCASAASIDSPESSNSSARPRPTSRGSRCVAP